MANRFSTDSARSARTGTESLTSLQRANVPGAFHLSSPIDLSESLREGLQADSSLIKSTNNPKRNPSRIIRASTIKEAEAPKIVTAEEWYEEMDCGICSHILGVPHALVPCGHTFCGPCAWQWIKSNGNLTCPHCRVAVSPDIPFVPNILLDQIIERKLGALPESTEKDEMFAERIEKAEAWKQLNSDKAKPEAKRTRGSLDDFMNSIFEHATPDFLSNDAVRRRASRHVQELGAPVPRRPVATRGATFNLGEARRIDEEAAIIQSRMDQRRLRDLREGLMLERLLEEEDVEVGLDAARGARTFTPPLRSANRFVPASPINVRGPDAMPAGQRVRPLPAPPVLSRPVYVSTRSTPEISNQPRQPPSLPPRTGQDYARRAPPPLPPREDITPNFAHHFVGRPVAVRSTALAARQARGRGTRDQPLVLLSDEE